jgi:DNA gyrase subunit B
VLGSALLVIFSALGSFDRSAIERNRSVESTHDWSVAVDADHLAEIRNAVGRYSDGGITHLVLEVLAYPLDEAASGTTDRVQVTLHADGSISIEDNGRGTATRYDDAGNPTVKPIMATRDLRFFGVADAPLLPDGRVRSGISVVAAMSEWLTHTNRRAGGRGWVQRYERGLPEGPRTEIASGNTTGTTVHFRPDTTVFGPERPSVQSLRALCSGFTTTATVKIHEATGV